MRYIRTQLVIVLIGLALVGVVLYNQAQGVRTVLEPAAGGTFIEGVVGEPTNLNPLLISPGPADHDLKALLHASLIRFDARGIPVPDLAQSWAVTSEGTAYTFVLRPDLQWSDGQPMNIDDVIFTLRLLQDPDFPGPADQNALWQSVNVVKLNETTLKIELPDPFAPFLDYMTFGVLPEHALPGVTAAQLTAQPFNFDPVGAGPFMLERLERDDAGRITEAVLRPNAFYHGDVPFVGEMRLRFFGSYEAAWQAYVDDEIIALGGVPPELLPAAFSAADTNIYSGRLPSYDLVLLNQGNEALGFFQDKKVRQALLAGINRQRLIDDLLLGQAVLATGPILPGTWAYNDNLIPVVYDPGQAAGLLDEAGWRIPDDALPGTADYVRQKDDQVLAFTLSVPDTDYHQQVSAVIVAGWQALGVRVEVDTVSVDDIYDTLLLPRAFEAVLLNFDFAGYPDPDPYPFWHQTEIESGQNYSGFENRAISELLEQARVIASLNDRAQLYRAFQARYTDETPAILLWYPVYTYVVDARVRGVRLGALNMPSERFNSLGDWYIVTRRVIVNE